MTRRFIARENHGLAYVTEDGKPWQSVILWNKTYYSDAFELATAEANRLESQLKPWVAGAGTRSVIHRDHPSWNLYVAYRSTERQQKLVDHLNETGFTFD